MSRSATFQEYVFGEVDDAARLHLQHDIFNSSFVSALNDILDKYGLADRLQNAIATGRKLRILDAGCGEGLYLHDVAEALEKRNLLAGADLNGIDIDARAIATAEQVARESKPPRPYLNFYVWDITRPLDDCLGLRQEGEARFDFIFALSLMTHLPNARQHLETLYQALKPGGIIYLRDIELDAGKIERNATHPVLIPFGRMFTGFLLSINKGVRVANEQAGWLREMGAEDVKSYPVNFPMGGQSVIGMQMLRRLVMLVRNSGPMLVSRGAMTQAQFDELMATLYRELTPEVRGEETWIDTLARKPL